MSSLDEFTQHRPRLFALAYRMLGTVTDAEDVLQDAWLRWTRAEHSQIDSPQAYLTSVVSRLCIDQLRSARVRREQYVGPWLPEPVVGPPGPEDALADSLSNAFLLLLESLSPVERAVFLLHDVFGYDFGEIGGILDKTAVSCRQIASRARRRIAQRRPRYEPPQQQHETLANEFLAACASGDLDGLMKLLAGDVVLQSDGGGLALAARRPIGGARNVARFLIGVFRKAPPGVQIAPAAVNGQPGWIATLDGKPVATYSLEIQAGVICGLYVMRNPEKLRHVAMPADSQIS